MDYYNDIEPFACKWLQQLSDAGRIPSGFIDSRSIKEIAGSDLQSYDRCHFFAGIAGWAEALRLAGWPRDLPVWTGSCPCQPFSSAGWGRGFDDERHLWPEFKRLIAECRPTVVIGEQVASKAGRTWLSVVRTDLEELGYAVGAADLCAAGVGSPHIRQRLYWVAYTEIIRSGTCGTPSEYGAYGSAGLSGGREPCGLADTESQRGSGRTTSTTESAGRGSTEDNSALTGDFWRDVEYVPCRDGKSRPIKPGIHPLAHGVRNRVGALRGAGNAIVPQVAAIFARSFLETLSPQ